MRRIGVISDTHIPFRGTHLPPRVFELFDGVDLIVHCGDINQIQVLKELELLAPVRAVTGNTDPYEVAITLPPKQIFTMEGFRIGVFHGHGLGTPRNNARRHLDDARCHVVLYGHSHCPENHLDQGVLYLNPGSATNPRCSPEGTVGILELTDRVTGRILSLEED